MTVGADVAIEAVLYAEFHYVDPTIAFTGAEAGQLPFPDATFDVVLSFETIEHLACPDRLVDEAARVLRPEGLLVCSTPNIERHSRAGVANEFHLSEMELGAFRRLIEARFRVERVWAQSESPAFRRHSGVIRELISLYDSVASSFAARLERRIRKLLGRQRPLHAPSGDLLNPVPGDFVIAPFRSGEGHPKTYIITGTKLPE
jgi:SAM-dependent methyltransferase